MHFRIFARQKFLNNAVTGGYFNIRKSFSPGWSAHQPQKSENKGKNEVLKKNKHELTSEKATWEY